MRFAVILSFIIFALSCKKQQKANSNIKAKQFHKIAFLLYENFDTALLNTAVAEASLFYKCNTVVMAPQELPAFAFYEPRNRYKADSLIKFQSSLVPAGAESIVGITHKDISTSLKGKNDWGIFGLGYCPGKACVISVFRLKSGSYTQYQERFVKVLLHELGHNQGLPHCNANEYCLMNDAKGSSATVDKEKKWLCSHCRQLLSN